MKIALPADEKSIETGLFDSFGKAPFFLIYNTNSKTIEYLDHRAVAAQGAGGLRAAQVLADNGVRAIITPNCGENAEKVLHYSEVLVYKSISGSMRKNIEAFLNNELNLLADFKSRD